MNSHEVQMNRAELVEAMRQSDRISDLKYRTLKESVTKYEYQC